jgi:DNA-binding transcriptional LysR family regulator
MRLNLDMDVLRTLAAARRLGGFARAAEAVGRSQSAVSQQLARLEAQLGSSLFRKQGRGLVPTEAGEALLAYAERLLALNDEAVAAVRGVAVSGVVRIGLPGDLADPWLAAILGRFRRAHPEVRVEAVVDRNRLLLERLDADGLDLVLAFGARARHDATPVAVVPRVWIGAADGAPISRPGEPLPLAVFDPPCFFRAAATEALDRAGLPWRVAFTSASLHGLWAAVEAGLGVTLRTAIALPPSLKVLDDLPPTPDLDLCLHDAGRAASPAVARLGEIITETLTAPATSPRPEFFRARPFPA